MNENEIKYIDIDFVDKKSKVLLLIKKFLDKQALENIEEFNSSIKRFKQTIKLNILEDYLYKNLLPKSQEYIDNAFGRPGYIYALLDELNISYRPIIGLEYESIGPCSFFQSIKCLDLGKQHIYYVRYCDEEGSEIFLRQEKKVTKESLRKIIFLYFKNMNTFNLSDSMLSLPSNFEIYDQKINNKDFLKSCFKEFLDNDDKRNQNERWEKEETDLTSRFEFEDNHYERSMSILKKLPDIIRNFNKKKKTYKKNEKELDKQRILKLIYFHKVKIDIKNS